MPINRKTDSTSHSSRPANSGKTPHTKARPTSARKHPASTHSRPKHGSKTTTRKTGQRKKPSRGGRQSNRHMRNKPTPHRVIASTGKKDDKIPPLAADSIRIIPLGGVEAIGRNMTAIEYGNDIIIVDCGFQFREDDTPGIDFILPNTKYLEDRKDRIRAMLITHGHLDHIGGIPFVIEGIGLPTIYSRRLTNVMIKKRQEEFPHQPKLDIRDVETDETIKIGEFSVGFFAVSHTIPDSMGIIIKTPFGSIVHTGDLKLDHVDGVPTEREEKEWSKLEKENVLLLMADSTNVDKPGFSFPEDEVHRNIEKIITEVKGRLVIGTFASQLERIIKMIEIAEKHKKKVVVEGRSMKTNVEIVRQLKMLNVDKHTFIGVDEMDNYPDNKLIILATGAQGDEFAALMRIATKTHKYFKVRKNDTIVLSASVIPGNERPVQKLKDNLSRQGAHIIDYKMAGVHSSGHANREETLWIHNKVKPKFFIPLHGYHYMLRVHGEIAQEAGLPENHIVIPDNSSIIEIRESGKKIVKLKEKAPAVMRIVDGFSIGDMQEVLVRDRKMLAQDGMFVIIATINPKTGKLRKSPDIISRGFVYLRESQELLQQTRLIIKRTVEKSAAGMNPIDFDNIKDHVADDVTKFLFQKTNKRPIVIPVVLGI